MSGFLVAFLASLDARVACTAGCATKAIEIGVPPLEAACR
jgi:hypothetical protein